MTEVDALLQILGVLETIKGALLLITPLIFVTCGIYIFKAAAGKKS